MVRRNSGEVDKEEINIFWDQLVVDIPKSRKIPQALARVTREMLFQALWNKKEKQNNQKSKCSSAG